MLQRKSGNAQYLFPNLEPNGSSMKNYTSPTPHFTWYDGTPTASGTETGGVFAFTGAYTLDNISPPSSDPGVTWKLKLNVGCFNTNCRLEAKGGQGHQMTNLVTAEGTTNMAYEITFTGSLSVRWGRDGDSKQHGNFAFQAASLEKSEPDIAIQAAVLRN
jgi:hypothetical protein